MEGQFFVLDQILVILCQTKKWGTIHPFYYYSRHKDNEIITNMIRFGYPICNQEQRSIRKALVYWLSKGKNPGKQSRITFLLIRNCIQRKKPWIKLSLSLYRSCYSDFSRSCHVAQQVTWRYVTRTCHRSSSPVL